MSTVLMFSIFWNSNYTGIAPEHEEGEAAWNPLPGPPPKKRAFLIPGKEVISMIKAHVLDRCELCCSIVVGSSARFRR